MSQLLGRSVTANSPSNKTLRNRRKRQRRRNRRRAARYQNRNIVLGTRKQPPMPQITRAVPAAFTHVFTGPQFTRVSSSNNDQTIRLRGFDLVQPVPGFQYMTGASGVFLVIPSNPAYWQGTRVAGVAAVYQQFRPLKFDVKYVPSVPVTVPGNVIYGTLWQQGVSDEALQQSLATSNGGGIVTCYQSAWSRVRCNNNTLPQKFYEVAGHPATQSANPFHWIAYYSGGGEQSAPPGYVIVHWEFEFTVGVGSQTRSFETISAANPSAKRLLKEANIVSFFGVPISILKTAAIRLLRKCAIVILSDVLSHLSQGGANDQTDESVTLPSGSSFEYLVGPQTNASHSIVTQGSDRYEVPDDTLVFILMNGQTVQRTMTSADHTPVIDLGGCLIDDAECASVWSDQGPGKSFVNIWYLPDVAGKNIDAVYTPISAGVYSCRIVNTGKNGVLFKLLTEIGQIVVSLEPETGYDLKFHVRDDSGSWIIPNRPITPSSEQYLANRDVILDSIVEEVDANSN